MEQEYKEIHTIEVKQTSLQSAINTYEFIVADLHEGLSYEVAKEVYCECMSAIGSPMMMDKDVDALKFCNDFYNEFKRIKGE